jgi:arsenical pump membrane protein
MGLPWLVVVLVEYAAVRLRFADGLAGGTDPEVSRASAPDVRRPTLALVLVGLMLLGFAVSSPLGVDPAWVAAAAAAALVVPARRSGALPPARLLRAAQPTFAVYVLGLVVVVAAVDHTFLGRFLRRLLDALPLRHLDDGGLTALGGLLLLTVLATALTSVLNNLPAVLLLVPLVAPLGTVAVLAVVVGVDVGAGLVYTGSLANLLWTRVLHGRGLVPSARAYHLHAALVTPVALTAAVVVLWAENGLGWVP